MSASRCPTPLASLLDVRREEIRAVATAALFFFCLLTALMLLRPARDALGLQHGMEGVRWLIVATAVVTLAMNPLFGWLVGRLRRPRLVGATYGFLILSLTGFWAVMTFAPTAIGQAGGQLFYVWFNVFNLFATMVFWALLAERFTCEQGRRFFALISVGGTLGAIFGPWLASLLAEPLGTAGLLPVACGFLLFGLVAAWRPLIAPGIGSVSITAASKPADEDAPIGGSPWAGIRSVCRSPFLTGVALYVMLSAIMVTFVYFTRLQMVAAIAPEIDVRAAILARIDMWTHLAVLTLQLTLAGPVVRRFGQGVTLAILPVVTALGFVGLTIYGSLVVLILLEAATRAVRRGITQPAREMLFTLVEREDKYKAKAFVDTFVYRAGDVIGAQAEGAVARLGMAAGGLIAMVVPLALVWVMLALWLGRARPLPGVAPILPAT